MKMQRRRNIREEYTLKVYIYLSIEKEEQKLTYEIKTELYDTNPEKVTTVKAINGVLHALVEWEVSSDGIEHDPYYVPCSLMASAFPKMLIDFYERRIKFIKK
jgi:hypothetical protein